MHYSEVSRGFSLSRSLAGFTVGKFGSFALAGIAGFALTFKTYTESFNGARLAVVLILLILCHLIRYPRFLFSREFALYSAFVIYMSIGLLWTTNIELGMNTVEPAVDFLLILILFGALFTYHDFAAVLAGTFGGFLLGAAVYTYTVRFPFAYPEDFSYGAIAGMYLFGLFVTLIVGWYTRSKLLSVPIVILLLLHIVATTSIKTNLGILLAAMGAGLIYYKLAIRALRRNTLPLLVLAAAIAYAVYSNDALVERLQAGVDRVMVGVEILKVQDNISGYSGYEERAWWFEESLRGWAQSPIFGSGVEAFRIRYGATSHSTPSDLLYNYGLIGMVLFYAIFLSMVWRLHRAPGANMDGLCPLIFGGVVCYVFMTLSGTMHYNTFLAGFIAISTALLIRLSRETSPSRLSSMALHS